MFTPAQMRGYLRLGARICGDPAHLPERGVAHFPALLAMSDLDRGFLNGLQSVSPSL